MIFVCKFVNALSQKFRKLSFPGDFQLLFFSLCVMSSTLISSYLCCSIIQCLALFLLMHEVSLLCSFSSAQILKNSSISCSVGDSFFKLILCYYWVKWKINCRNFQKFQLVRTCIWINPCFIKFLKYLCLPPLHKKNKMVTFSFSNYVIMCY